MPQRYHPIADSLWDDAKLETLSFEGKAFFCFLCANRRQRPSGIYRATDAQLAADTGLPLKAVKSYLVTLQSCRVILRDGAWIFIRSYLKRQPKQERLLLGVESDVKDCDSRLILEAFGQQYPIYNRWSTDRLLSFSENVSANTTQTQTQLQTQPQLPSPRALPETVEWGQPYCLILKYNKEAPDNVPSVRSLSEARVARERQFLRMFPDEQWWSVTFRQYHRSKFLSGRSNNGDGHKSFQPDFDWLLSKGKDGIENCVKVHDGRYCDG